MHKGDETLAAFIEKTSDFIETQRENALAWGAVCLGLGSAFYFSLLSEPSYVITITAFVCIFIFHVWSRYNLYRELESLPRYVLYLLAGALLCIAIGFSLAQLRTVWQGTPMVTSETRPVKIAGVIAHLELQEEGKGVLVIMRDVSIDRWLPVETPRQVRLTIRKKIDAVVGDHISLLAKLTPPSPPVLPDGFDFQRHYYFEGIGALGFSLSDITVTQHSDDSGFFLTKLRNRITAHIKKIVPDRQAGIVAALMTGERAAIYEEDWQALRVSGLAHIISISGLHVAMVAGPIFFLVRFFLALIPFLALNYPIKKMAAACALIVACLYVGLVVPSVPTTRALLMTGVMLIAVMLDRSPISMRLVAVSAIIVLLFQPESIWSASFQMSFAAVAALVAVAEALAPFWSAAYAQAGWFKRSGLWAAGALLTSLVAALATAPFSLYHFGQFATYSVFANFVSIPLSGLIIMPMLMVSFVLMPFGLDMWSLELMGKGVEWLLDVARTTENLPYAQLSIAAPPVSFLIGSSASGILLLFLRGRSRFISVIPALVSVYCLITTTQPVMLVSEDGSVIALYDDNHMTVSSAKRSKFITDSWRKNFGVASDKVAAFPREGSFKNINCGGGLCRMVVAGQNIAYGDKLYELHQDCAWADIIITSVRTSRDFCAGKKVTVIDYYFLKRQGAVALYTAGEHQLEMKTVAAQRGGRPWTDQQRRYSISRKDGFSSLKNERPMYKNP